MEMPMKPAAADARKDPVPLCIDLDDTLIRTDVLWEAAIQLLRHPILAARALLVLALKGKAGFKSLLAEHIPLDASTLPYREEIVVFARAQHEAGREVALATATHRLWAQQIADHLGIFQRVFATDRTLNLSGANKRDALKAAYGERGFDYVGDNRKDLPIFAAARRAILVNPAPSLLRKASTAGNVEKVFLDDADNSFKVIVRALRVHQWSKNVLLVIPLLAAHLVLDPRAWANFAVAFLAFSFVASATYLINDLLDLRSDRTHPQKRSRPLASGRLKVQTAIALAATLGGLGTGLSLALLPPLFVVYLGFYVVLTLAYSIDLKRRLLIDALTLAILYTLRILAGGAAVNVPVSEWLLMFSLFIFLSLAFLKRIIELKSTPGDSRLAGRGYSAVDLETIRVIGLCSGLISVMVMALYISSPAVALLYNSPQILWLICPLLIYWIARIWFLAARDQVNHDPVVFALFDWRSYMLGVCVLAVIALATIGKP